MAVADDIQPGDGGLGYSWFAVEVVSYPVYDELPGEAETIILKLHVASAEIFQINVATGGIVRRHAARADLRKRHGAKGDIIKRWDADTDIEPR